LKQDMDLGPMIVSKTTDKQRSNSGDTTMSNINRNRYFYLACSLYKNERPDDNLMQSTKSCFSDSCRLFFVSDENFLYPAKSALISAKTVWQTAEINISGIFRKRVKISDSGHKCESILYTIYLGKNSSGNEITAAILQKLHRHHAPDSEHRLYGFLGNLKRYYTELVDSPTLTNFIRNKSAVQYVIDSETNEVIAMTIPPSGNLIINPRIKAPEIFEKLQTQFPEIGDKHVSRGNLGISNFSLMGKSYSILSINQSNRKERGLSDNRSRDEYIENIRAEITVIRDAAEQLSLRKGILINDNDITQSEIIRKSTNNLEYLIEQFSGVQDTPADHHISREIDNILESVLSAGDTDTSNGNISEKGKLVSVEN